MALADAPTGKRAHPETAPAGQIVEAARTAVPVIAAHRDEGERARRIPEAVLRASREAGLYRLLVPRALGGDQADLQMLLDVVELISEADGSAGWNLATASFGTLVALALPPEGVERVFGGGPDVIFAGSAGVGQDATAVPAPGGYRVTGRWRYGSGCIGANWLYGGCRVVAGDGGAPRLRADGQPEVRRAYFPADQCQILDTWHVAGLRGTGSHDWAVEDVFVPEALTQVPNAPRPWHGPLYAPHSGNVLHGLHFSAVATGIAQAALHALVHLAQTKVPLFDAESLKHRAAAQEATGRAEALLGGARAYRAATVAEIWAAAAAGSAFTPERRLRARLAATYAVESATGAVDLLYRTGGTTSIWDECALSRCFRDVHVVAQNWSVLPQTYEAAGRVRLGLDMALMV